MKKAKSSEKELRSRYPVTFKDLPGNAVLDPVEELGMVGAQQAADYLGIGTGKLRRMWTDNTADLVALGARAMTAKTATQGMDGVQLLGSGERSVALTSGERWVMPKLSHHYYTAPSLAYLQDKLGVAKVAPPAVVSPIPAATANTALSQDVRIFENPEFGRVRATIRDGEPWFVLKDVCQVLGISKYRDVANRLESDEREPIRVDTLGGAQEMTCINESGLYSVILRSDKPNAKPFRKWVTSEVLPSIRKTGGYSLSSAKSTMPAIPPDYPSALRALADTHETCLALEAKMQADSPKVEFATQIIESKGTISIGDFAKAVSKRGYLIGRNTMFAWMRESKILDKNNIPYQNYMNEGYFEVIEVLKYGTPRTVTRITGKGQAWLYKLLSKTGRRFR